MSQREMWAQVQVIKRSVKQSIGDDLSHEFRSSQPYQAYTGLCGEACFAYEDSELDDELIEMLDEYAKKVIVLKQSDPA